MIDTSEAKAVKQQTIPVSEIFGPTLEGEGPWAGQPTYFLRIGGCDYSCVWCDTDQAVLPERVRALPRMSQSQIWDTLYAYTLKHPGPDLLAISGGNPGLYDLSQVVDNWQAHDRTANGHDLYAKKVLVETQGSRWQPWFGKVDLLTVSPKPPSSGLDHFTSFNNLYAFMDYVGEVEEYWARSLGTADLDALRERWQMIFKVVVFDEADYQFARDLHMRYPLVPFHLSTGTAMGGLSGKWVPPPIPDLDLDEEVDWHRQKREFPEVKWFSPAVDTKEGLLRRYRWLAERAMNDSAMADAKVQVQLHCLLWGITTKGV